MDLRGDLDKKMPPIKVFFFEGRFEGGSPE